MLPTRGSAAKTHTQETTLETSAAGGGVMVMVMVKGCHGDGDSKSYGYGYAYGCSEGSRGLPCQCEGRRVGQYIKHSRLTLEKFTWV